MGRGVRATAGVVGLVALCAASLAGAQSVPRTGDFGDRLPAIPTVSAAQAGELALEAVPRLGRSGILVAPGVVVDRVVRPRCVFIANQNQGGGSVRQTAQVGRLQFYCP